MVTMSTEHRAAREHKNPSVDLFNLVISINVILVASCINWHSYIDHSSSKKSKNT